MDGSPTFVGIDVAKASLDVAMLPLAHPLSLAYDDDGIARIIAALRKRGECLIVVESTGGYERRLVTALVDAGFRVARVNPRQVRDFARGLGQLAKTDRLDAQLLAQFAQHVQPQPLEKHPEKQAELDQLVTRRRQLIDLRTAESNRRELTTAKAARRSIERVLKVLDQQIDAIEQAIAQLIESHDDWRHKADLLESVPGVGPATSSGLIAKLPELGRLGRQRIAALVGLAPYNDDSGPQRGQRSIYGGRESVRGLLYMAAFAARRCNPTIRAFAQRLEAAGKPFKVVLTACMRKLLVMLNAMVKHNTTWSPPCGLENA